MPTAHHRRPVRLILDGLCCCVLSSFQRTGGGRHTTTVPLRGNLLTLLQHLPLVNPKLSPKARPATLMIDRSRQYRRRHQQKMLPLSRSTCPPQPILAGRFRSRQKINIYRRHQAVKPTTPEAGPVRSPRGSARLESGRTSPTIPANVFRIPPESSREKGQTFTPPRFRPKILTQHRRRHSWISTAA